MKTISMRALLAVVIVVAGALVAQTGALAGTATGSVTWSGYGSKSDGTGGLVPKESKCAPSKYALAPGPYLLFELEDAKYVIGAKITVGTNPQADMTPTKKGDKYTYLYTADSINLKAILDGGVTVSYDAKKKTSPRLELEKGCVTGGGGGGGDVTVPIVYLGEASGDAVYRDLDSTSSGRITSITACQESSANCVTFTKPTSPNTVSAVKSLTVPSGSKLTFSIVSASCDVHGDWTPFAANGAPWPAGPTGFSITPSSGPATTANAVDSATYTEIYLGSWCPTG